MVKRVQVRWYCGRDVGLPSLAASDSPQRECGTFFDTFEDVGDWEDGHCSAACFSCGAVLYQSMDIPELVGVVEG